MCRDIERQDVNEAQIPGIKIEPQRPLLDTLGHYEVYHRGSIPAFSHFLIHVATVSLST